MATRNDPTSRNKNVIADFCRWWVLALGLAGGGGEKLGFVTKGVQKVTEKKRRRKTNPLSGCMGGGDKVIGLRNI